MDSVKVFSPASVANVGCGYDIFGFALEAWGDEIQIRKRNDSQLVITGIEGAQLPLDPEKNVATVAVHSLLRSLGSSQGFDISIRKNVSPGSGLGSSASSAAGAVFGANELLGKPLSKHQLIQHAMQGEALASEKPHADNVAPAMLGGFTVVRSCEPEVDVFQIPYPVGMRAFIIFPQIQVKTAEAKKMLGNTISIDKARTQWGNVAGMVAGLVAGDWALISRSLQDVVAEPLRKSLIPHYDTIKTLALNHGARGFNISGSGPSMFALFEEDQDWTTLIESIKRIYDPAGIATLFHVSPINQQGTQTVEV